MGFDGLKKGPAFNDLSRLMAFFIHYLLYWQKKSI